MVLPPGEIPEVQLTTPIWNSDGGVDYGYKIENKGLPQSTTISLDWASGTTLSSILGNPIATTTTETGVGTYDLHATEQDIGSAPQGATELLVVLGAVPGLTSTSTQSLSLSTIDLDPLEVQGNFQFDAASQQFVAEGTTSIGLKPSDGSTFTPLITVDGTVSYDHTTIHAEGTVSATIANVTVPLFQGTWTIDVGKAVTDALSEGDSLPNQFTLAGAQVTISQLALVAGDDGGEIDLQGAIVLPKAAGGVSLAVNDPDKIVINKDGVSLTGGSLHIPDITIRVQNVLNVEAKGLSLTYEAQDPSTGQPSFKLQGDVRIPALHNFEVNFADPNYILIQNNDVELVGEISAGQIPLGPGWSLEKVEIKFDTVNKTFEGSATVDLPEGIKASGTIAFAAGSDGELELSSLAIKASFNNAFPIGDTGAFLQEIHGSVTHIATSDPTPTLFEGGVVITAGPEIDLHLPSFLGGELAGSLLEIDADASIDSNHLTGTGQISIIKAKAGGATALAASASASVTIDWAQHSIQGAGSFQYLDNTIDGTSSFQMDSSLNLTMNGSATIQFVPNYLPDAVKRLLSQLGSVTGTVYLTYTNGAPYSSDYIEVTATYNVPGISGTISERIDFNGNVSDPSSQVSGQVVNGSDDGSSGSGSGLHTDALRSSPAKAAFQTYLISPNTPTLLLSAVWGNTNKTPLVEVTAPNGTVYFLSDLPKNAPVKIVSEMSGPGIETVGVLNPKPGDWTIRIANTSALGSIHFDSLINAKQATVNLTSLNEDINGHAVDIDYTTQAGQFSSTMSLYYTTMAGSHDGSLIASGLPVTNGASQFVWNTANLPSGTYYVFAVSDDGKTPLVFADAKNPIITGGQTLALSPITNVTTQEGSKVTFRETATDPNPGSPIRYSLAPGAPADAQIDPNTGDFVWLPANPGVYSVTVIAADSATPALSNRQTITITVTGAASTASSASVLALGRDAFVATLYNEGLNRSPEPNGLQFWSRLLTTQINPLGVARAIWKSPEHRTEMKQQVTFRTAFAHWYHSALVAGQRAVRSSMATPKGPLALDQRTALLREPHGVLRENHQLSRLPLINRPSRPLRPR